MSEPESGQARRERAGASADENVEELDASALETSPPPSAAPPSATSQSSPPSSTEESGSLLKQLTVGTIIDGKYQVDQIIGKGAMGVVLAATHVHLKERVALKFLSTRATSQADDFHSRFRREAQVSAKLRNEHITRVIDVGVWREKIPFMVMDLLVGDDLRRTLRQAPNGRLPPPVALDYIVQICEGLAEAHSHGIVHRDLKPSNIFVTKRHDGTDLIKILDFGISKWSTQHEELDELTQTGVVLGSPKYMSPEQLFGSASVDARADIWSLGAIFYEMITGRPPYDYPTLTRICAELATDRAPPPMTQFVPDLPPQLEAVVMQTFVRDRDRRVPNVAELAGLLLEAVEVPFAGQVRMKISSMLDPKGQPAALSSTTGGMPVSTGNYRSLSVTGSHNSPISSSSAIRIGRGDVSPSSAATAGGVEALVPGEAAGKRRGVAIAVISAIAAVCAILAFVGSRGKDAVKEPSPPAASTVAVAPAAQPPPPAPAPPPAMTATAPSTASADSARAKPAAAPPPAPPPPSHPVWGGNTRRGGGGVSKGSSPPPPPPASTQASAPSPPPAPAPAPAPTKAANPLEDRQ